MAPEEKEALRQRIHETITRLEADIVALIEETKPIAPDGAYGRVSRIDAINNKSVNEASLRMSRSKLSRLQLALTKIDEEGFGKCLSCGKTINPKRLMFLPESTRCVACADR